MLLFKKGFAIISLIVLFFKEIFISSYHVLVAIYTYSDKYESDFFELTTTCKNHTQQVIIAHFMTLTPGTMSVDILENNKILVHILDKQKVSETKKLIRDRVEPHLKTIWRKK